MTSTISPQNRVAQIDHEVARLTPFAEAERAWQAATPHEEVPQFWQGASARVESLQKERTEIILAAKGELLAAKLDEKKQIEKRIEEARLVRERADKHCATLAADETVARFLNGGSVARRKGWGYSWAANFVPWFLSGKARHAGLTEEGAFFMDPQQCPAILLFTEKERIIIREHNEARGAAILALTVLDGETSRLASLIRQYPELQGV